MARVLLLAVLLVGCGTPVQEQPLPVPPVAVDAGPIPCNSDAGFWICRTAQDAKIDCCGVARYFPTACDEDAPPSPDPVGQCAASLRISCEEFRDAGGC